MLIIITSYNYFVSNLSMIFDKLKFFRFLYIKKINIKYYKININNDSSNENSIKTYWLKKLIITSTNEQY
jgi:hypothetical protein